MSNRAAPPSSAPLRALLVVTILAAAMVLVGAAAADHPALDHLHVIVEDVEGGDTHRIPINSTTHGDLRAGWIYILYAHAEGNHSLQVELEMNGTQVDRFTWMPGGFNTNTTKIQETGPHELAITNPGNSTVRFAFYYDQSCNCDGKQIPLPGGVVMFNYPFPADAPVKVAYPIALDWHVKGTLATHDDGLSTAHWPEDFEILEETEAQGPGAGQTGRNWLNFTFQTDKEQVYYVHLKALHGAQDSPVVLSAEIDVDEAEAAPAPPLALFLLFATLAVGALRHRFRKSA